MDLCKPCFSVKHPLSVIDGHLYGRVPTQKRVQCPSERTTTLGKPVKLHQVPCDVIPCLLNTPGAMADCILHSFVVLIWTLIK